MRIWSIDCPESETKRQRSERILLDVLKDGDLGRDLRYVERLRQRRNRQTSDAMENIFDFMNCGVQRWDDDAYTPMITYRPRYIRYPRTYVRAYPYYSSLGRNMNMLNPFSDLTSLGWNMNMLNPFFDLSSLASPCGHVYADPLASLMMNNAIGGLPYGGGGCLAGGFCPWQRLMRMAKNGMGPLGPSNVRNGGWQNGNMWDQGMGLDGNMWNQAMGLHGNMPGQGIGLNGNMGDQGMGLKGNMGTQGIGFDGNEGMIGSGNKEMDELTMRRGWQAARAREEQRRQDLRDAEQELNIRRYLDTKWAVFKDNPHLVSLVEAQQRNGFPGLAGGFPAQHAEQNLPTMPRPPRYAEDEELSERRPRQPRRRRPRYDYSPSWDDGYGMASGRQGAYYGRRQGPGRVWGGNNRFGAGDANSVLDEDSDLGISEEGSGDQFSHPRGRPAPDQRRGQRRHHHDFGSPFDGPANRRAPFMDGGFSGGPPRMRRPGNGPGQRSSNERRAPST